MKNENPLVVAPRTRVDGPRVRLRTVRVGVTLHSSCKTPFPSASASCLVTASSVSRRRLSCCGCTSRRDGEVLFILQIEEKLALLFLKSKQKGTRGKIMARALYILERPIFRRSLFVSLLFRFICVLLQIIRTLFQKKWSFSFSQKIRKMCPKNRSSLCGKQPTFFSTKGQEHRSGTPKDENKLKNKRHALPKGREELKQKPRGKNQ